MGTFQGDRDDRELLQAIKWKQLSGDKDDQDDPNASQNATIRVQNSDNNFINGTNLIAVHEIQKYECRYNKFPHHYVKTSLADSSAGRTPKEKFLVVSPKFSYESMVWTKFLCLLKRMPNPKLMFSHFLLCLLQCWTLRISKQHTKMTFRAKRQTRRFIFRRSRRSCGNQDRPNRSNRHKYSCGNQYDRHY